MKKYNQFIKESNTKFLAAMTDEDLEERLSFLRLQLSELQEEILTIVNIQKDRKNRENNEYAKTLPASIYDFNEEQLDFIFQGDPRSDKQYEIQRQYYGQLQGVFPSMTYDKNTDQKVFSIVTRDLLDDNEEELDEEKVKIAVKNIKFLANKLKKPNNDQFGEFIMFHVLYSYSEDYNDRVIYKDKEILLHNGYRIVKIFSDIEDLLKHLVENDLYYKDRDN
jgi:hypothetical protein